MRRVGIQQKATFIVALTALTLSMAPAAAEFWPQRPVRIVVPIAAGSSPDVAARVFAQRGKAPRAVGLQLRLVASAAADHDWQAAQLGIAQQLDRRVEGVHVEVRDEAPEFGGHGRKRGTRAREEAVDPSSIVGARRPRK